MGKNQNKDSQILKMFEYFIIGESLVYLIYVWKLGNIVQP